MAQIRELLTEFAVLPLGAQRVHERLEPHIKALLLYGHHNTGKKLLVNAIAHSTGAHCPYLRAGQSFRKLRHRSCGMCWALATWCMCAPACQHVMCVAGC